MPRLRPLLVTPWLLGCLWHAPAALGQTAPTQPNPPAAQTPQPSALDAELFYQLLLGELQRRTDPGAAYSLILDAAKRTRQPELFQRAIEIALQGRAPQAALTAARDWSAALPSDDEARRLAKTFEVMARQAGIVLVDGDMDLAGQHEQYVHKDNKTKGLF